MFRSAGQPKTAAHLLCNVAWGTSLGGLALLAEERRRRIAIAQKIIENGKKLHAYKAYTGVASLAAFDLGNDWDTRLPNIQEPEGKRATDGEILTNKEWRSRGRIHRLIPSGELGLSSQSAGLKALRLDPQIPLLSYLKSVIPVPSSRHREEAVRGATQLESEDCTPVPTSLPTLADQSSVHEPTLNPDLTAESSGEYTQRKRYSLHLQTVVGTYANTCLRSNDAKIRAAGFHELASFFDRPRRLKSPELEVAIAAAFAAPEAEVSGSLAEKTLSLIQSSIDWSHKDQKENLALNDHKQSNLVRNVKITRPFSIAQVLPHDEQRYAETMRSSLESDLLDEAFFTFLTMCENLSQPMGKTTRGAIRKLTSAYKSLGLYSVVNEIHAKMLYDLKEWRLLYHDILWLMDQRLPQTNGAFVWNLVQTLLGLNNIKHDSLVHLSVRLLNWFAEHNHVEEGAKLFLRVFIAGHVQSRDSEVTMLAESLYEACITTGNFEQAGHLLNWLTESEVPVGRKPDTVERLVVALNQHGHEIQAAQLYTASSACWKDLPAPTQFYHNCAMSYPKFSGMVSQIIKAQVPILNTQEKYRDIVHLSKLVNDVAGLGREVEALVYRAYALAGPILEAHRILDDLAKSDVPLWSNLVHDSHSALLNRCWKQTRNFEMVQGLFNSIQAIGFRQGRCVKTFNAIILASVEAGKPEEAQCYFDQMLYDERIKPNLYSWSNLMLAKAVAKDWSALSGLLQKAQEQGVLPLSGGYDGAFFDKSFAAFSCHHNAEEIADYAMSLSMPDKMSITSAVSNCVVDATIKAENIALLTKWVEHMHLRGYEVEVGKESVSRILQRIMQSKRLRFHPVLVEAHQLHQAAAKVDIPQLLDKLNAVIVQQRPGPQRTTRSRKVKHESRRATERAMLKALANNKPEYALQLYHSSLEHGLPKQQLDLELAVRASLIASPNSPETASKLIEHAKLAGLNTDRAITPLILHRLQEKSLSYGEAHRIAFQYYNSVDEPRIPLHHHVTLALARNLNDHGNPAGALRLLQSASDSEWGQVKPFDISTLTMILRLLIRQRRRDGVDWVVRTVLERNLRIDPVFIHTLHEGLRRASKRHPRLQAGSVASQDEEILFEESLRAYISTCRERRAQQRATTMEFAKDTVDLLRRQKIRKIPQRAEDLSMEARA